MTYIIGHRGAPKYEPENTIESFKKAIEFGADFIECDIHLTKDNRVVVIHDHTLNRTTIGRGYVKDFYLEELKRVLIEKTNSRIPTLEEVLELNFPTVIELKSFQDSAGKYMIYPGLVNKILELVRGFKPRIIFVSFDQRYLEELRGCLFDKMLLSSSFPINLDKIQRLNLIGLGIKYNALNSENIKKAHENNFKILAYTVNKKRKIKKMLKLGVDFIASDNSKLAVKCAKKFKPPERDIGRSRIVA